MTLIPEKRKSIRRSRVSLFITCLGDQFLPQVGVATVELLERLGLKVDFPEKQTCCGQPAYNTGYREEARAVARGFLDAFDGSECVVAPSGSCTAFVRKHLPGLFAGEPEWKARADRIAATTYELSEFLVKVLGIEDVGAAFPARAAYHSSCHLLRELGVRDEPRRLLAKVRGLTLVPMENEERCCGFGGTFSVKHSELSETMLAVKLKAIVASGAEYVVSCDPGCLINLAGGLSRIAAPVRAIHLAEILARRA